MLEWRGAWKYGNQMEAMNTDSVTDTVIEEAYEAFQVIADQPVSPYSYRAGYLACLARKPQDTQRLDCLEEQGGFHMAQRALDAAWRRKEDNPYQLTPTVRRAIDETMMR